MYTGEMWFGIVEKLHPCLILRACSDSSNKVDVMISATLNCFFCLVHPVLLHVIGEQTVQSRSRLNLHHQSDVAQPSCLHN